MTPSAQDLRPGVREDELAAIVALLKSAVVTPEQVATFVDHFGSAVDVVRASVEDQLHSYHRFEAVIGAVTSEDINRAKRDVEAWKKTGHDVRSVLDPTYPQNLHAIFNKPPILFFAGEWDEQADARAVAVVGTRKPTPEGVRRAGQLSRDLVRGGFTVISGLAKGIDTAAHTSALQAGGRTAAVMGTGIDLRYPAENAPLAEAILKSGAALISQYFPLQPPTRWTFPKRNVVMSGLCLATVVVEAGVTSGARMQARVALQHGRSVFLLHSLVQDHEWAKKYVTEGAYGTRAIEIHSSDELMKRLDLVAPQQESLAV